LLSVAQSEQYDTTNTEINKKVDKIFSSFKNEKSASVSAVIKKNDQVIYQKSFGMAEINKYLKATDKSNYRLASVSKQFTAMAVAILIDSGRLDLSSTLVDIFPSFPNYGNKITVKHLLHHTSGLIDYVDLVPRGQIKQVTDLQVFNLLKIQNRTYFVPGEKYRYSNSGYALLSVIVEKMSSMTFRDYLKEYIFRPLKMNETVAHVEGETNISNRAFGYTYSNGKYIKTDQNLYSGVLGDGGIYSSITDIIKWRDSFYSKSLVSSDMYKRIFSQGDLGNGKKTNYGFGWRLGKYRGVYRRYHTGKSIGFRSVIVDFPDIELSIVILSNSSNTNTLEFANKIADYFIL